MDAVVRIMIHRLAVKGKLLDLVWTVPDPTQFPNLVSDSDASHPPSSSHTKVDSTLSAATGPTGSQEEEAMEEVAREREAGPWRRAGRRKGRNRKLL